MEIKAFRSYPFVLFHVVFNLVCNLVSTSEAQDVAADEVHTEPRYNLR